LDLVTDDRLRGIALVRLRQRYVEFMTHLLEG
jgi:hypothetical protein